MANRSVLQKIGGVFRRVNQAIASDVAAFNDRNKDRVLPTPVVRQGQGELRTQAQGALVQRGTQPSASKAARTYTNALKSDAYKNATPEQRRKFRRGSLADIAKGKDVA